MKLGDTVKHTINGMTGVVTGRAEYLHSGPQAWVTARNMTTDGLPAEAWISEGLLEVVADDNPKS